VWQGQTVVEEVKTMEFETEGVGISHDVVEGGVVDCVDEIGGGLVGRGSQMLQIQRRW